MSLAGKVLFITGASRGIGKAIAIRAARDGASIAIAAKTADPNPKLPGTIYSAAKDIEAAGGKALPIQCDIRNEEQVKRAVDLTVSTFGKIDIVINNASAISLTGTESTDVKRYDLMHSINGRGTWMVSKFAIEHLKKSDNPHILNISPPLSMEEKWFAPFPAYTIAKYNMSLCVLGMAGEFRQYGVGVNALWPLTMIETAALKVADKGNADTRRSRTPEIMADAAYHILTQKSTEFTGNFCLDELLLRKAGVADFEKYSNTPGTKLEDLSPDFFLDSSQLKELYALRKKQTVFITGGTRGIGRAIALRCARDGAQIAIVARRAADDSLLSEIQALGGRALAIACDIQSEQQVKEAVSQTVSVFGGIDVLVNNATTLVLKNTTDISMDEYDLMNRINTRGTFAVVKYALPHLQKSGNGHILTLCPKPQLDGKWFEKNLAYSTSKFTMGLMAFGLSAEQRPFGVASNTLWPFSTIDTDGLAECGNEKFQRRPRKPAIMADAAHWIVTQDSRVFTGNFCLDEIVLREAGVADFEQYNTVKGTKLSELSQDHMITEEQLAKLAELRRAANEE
ncbi:NAD(P)-binding protein [Martensiomyces pterosporus]|nr:NAD(P)-binding protein [Martensiomyces pterosporus]